jgi:hypothetical protein
MRVRVIPARYEDNDEGSVLKKVEFQAVVTGQPVALMLLQW